MFAVFRHPDIATAGVVTFDSADLHRVKGWHRVSAWSESSGFNLPDFPADAPDLDAPPAIEPATKAAKNKE